MLGDIMGISRLRMGIDGKGITTLVGFFGCPLHCKYCLNEHCHEGSGTARAVYTPKELIDVLKKDDIYYCMTGGGITFGGGEPLLQSAFIHEVCELADKRWKKNIETSLNVPWGFVEPLINEIDEWIIDIKEMDEVLYEKYTGASIDNVKNNLLRLRDSVDSSKIHIKVPKIHNFNNEENVEKSVKWIKENLQVEPEVFGYIVLGEYKEEETRFVNPINPFIIPRGGLIGDPRYDYHEKISDAQETISKLIAENPQITREELAKACGVSLAGIKWLINNLPDKVGKIVKFGIYKSVEIKWRVLDVDMSDNTALLVSEYGWEEMRFDAKSNNWSNSEIRKWLNETFYNAFTPSEQAKIISRPGGEKVFLLSKEEVEYFCTKNNAGICYPQEASDPVCWWLRSPGSYPNFTMYVDRNGVVCDGSFVHLANCYVRPAILVKESYSDYEKKGSYHIEEAQKQIKCIEEEEKAKIEAEKRVKDEALRELLIVLKCLVTEKRAKDGSIWDCSCGNHGIKGKFCPKCGNKRPESVQTDISTGSGMISSTHSDATWDCSCGNLGIKSKFCPKCGTKKPGLKIEETTIPVVNKLSDQEAFKKAQKEGTFEAWQNFIEHFPTGTLAAKAQNEIGKLYYNGYKVAQNYAEAAKWYKKAAEQGNAEAQNSIGSMYFFGQGVLQDYDKAVKWYEKAVNQENSDGEYNLAYCYHHGHGVEVDDVYAKFLLKQAAEHGNVEARQALKEWFGGWFKKMFN